LQHQRGSVKFDLLVVRNVTFPPTEMAKILRQPLHVDRLKYFF